MIGQIADATTKEKPTMSKRKYASDCKVHEKIVSRAIKHDLFPDYTPLVYAIWGV